MSQTYFAILTAIGEAKLANATALGTTLQLTQMGVGDGNGSTPLPNRNQTTLLRENRRAPLNRLFVDPANASQIIAEQVIPEEIGGWWIREIGLYDAEGNLCAVANCPDTYKPVLAEGSGRTQVIRMVLIVSNTSAVQLKIDPAIVLATRGYVDDEFSKHLAALDPHPQYMTPLEVASAISGKADKATTLAGYGIADAVSKNGDTVSGLLNLDGGIRLRSGHNLILKAASGSTDPGDVVFVSGDDTEVARIWVDPVSRFLRVVSEKDASQPLVLAPGVVMFFAASQPPEGWLKCNGAAISRISYERLFSAIGTTFGVGNGSTTFNLPDLRGEFLRGWDDSRGVDAGRGLGAPQAQAIEAHTHLVALHRADDFNFGVHPMGSDTTAGTLNSPSITSTGGAETRPRNVALLACIKY